MYIIVHESRDTKNKYIISYDIHFKKFFIENELHELMELSEKRLYDLLHGIFINEF